MSRPTFEQLRLPLAIALVVVAAFALWPRGGADPDPGASTRPSVVVGDVGGVVVSPSPSEPAPTPSPAPSPSVAPSVPPSEAAATTAPTPAPAPDGFTAEVLACRSISGSTCNDQLGTLPANAPSFTALVRFTDANAGDEMNAVLSGPAGVLPGFPYTLQGSGDGYYYSQFQASGLPGGTYTLTATRNGVEVAVTSFRIAGR